MPKGTKIELAYLAGLIDGEGSIGLYETTSPNAGWRNYGLNLIVNMCDIEGIELLRSIYGGHLSMRKKSKACHRQQYRLKLGRHATYACLKDLLPYLRIKRLQAELAIQFAATVGDHNRKGRGAKLPQEIVDQRNIISLQLKEAKRAA